MHTPLTKLKVAKRQLSTAIDLYFAGRDVVSVYSLAANAWEVVDVLCRKAGVDSFSVQAREYVPYGKDLKLHYINSPYRNFFKHADNDSEKNLDPIPDSQVEGILFLAVEDYIRLNNCSPVQLQVYQLWYLAKHPEKLEPAASSELIEGIENAFPALSSLPNEEQLARGADMLAQALKDEALLNDPRTEAMLE